MTALVYLTLLLKAVKRRRLERDIARPEAVFTRERHPAGRREHVPLCRCEWGDLIQIEIQQDAWEVCEGEGAACLRVLCDCVGQGSFRQPQQQRIPLERRVCFQRDGLHLKDRVIGDFVRDHIPGAAQRIGTDRAGFRWHMVINQAQHHREQGRLFRWIAAQVAHPRGGSFYRVDFAHAIQAGGGTWTGSPDPACHRQR